MKKILELARKNGFHSVKRLGMWQNHNVYEPIFTDNEIHYIGFPQFILVKDGKIRWTKDCNESMDILGYFNRQTFQYCLLYCLFFLVTVKIFRSFHLAELTNLRMGWQHFSRDYRQLPSENILRPQLPTQNICEYVFCCVFFVESYLHR